VDLKLKGEGDQYLIEAFTLNRFSRSKLVKLNCCRLYLQIVMLSNTIDGSGNNICQYSFKGIKYPWKRN